MSLVKKPTMRKLVVAQRNARLSRGPATSEGRERVRAAHLVHGFYNDPNALLHAEDGRFQLSPSCAPNEPAHEDETPGAGGRSLGKTLTILEC